MKLLHYAMTRMLDNGETIPDDIRALLIDAGLQITSATMLAPYVHWQPINFPIERIFAQPSGQLVAEQLRLSHEGILGGKLEWLRSITDGLVSLRNAAAAFEARDQLEGARELLALLARSNLLLGMVEAIRDVETLGSAAYNMASRYDDYLATFITFGIMSPELLGWLLATRKTVEKEIPLNAAAWNRVAEAAFEVWEQADVHASRARVATSYTTLLEETMISFAYYEGSVRLFYDAMRRYAEAKKDEPTELLQDFRVVEEYRVGALELLKYQANHLVSRVCHFFPYTIGLSMPEAVRRALNAARAEISVYPQAVAAIWLDVAQELAKVYVPPIGDEYWELLILVSTLVTERIKFLYSDTDVVQTAFRMHGGTATDLRLSLEKGWQDRLCTPTGALLRPEDYDPGVILSGATALSFVEPGGKTSGAISYACEIDEGRNETLSVQEIPAGELMSRWLGGALERLT